MAEVQWIKLMVGMFDGNSFKKIKRARIGGVPFRDKLTSVWFELLDLAGKSNASGYLIDNNEIPYRSFEDIATMLDREEKEIELCMQFFINERMVEIIDDIYCLSNFTRFQNQEGLEKIREQTRKRVAKHRERKLLAQGNAECNVTVTLRNDIEKEEEEEKDKEKEFHSFSRSDETDYIQKKVEESELEGADAEKYKKELKEGLKLKYMGGTLGQGVLFISDEQLDDLFSRLSFEEVNKYIDIVVECEKNGKRFKKKSHYQAILDMVEKDRRIK
jgi:predicted phage replisome organizer